MKQRFLLILTAVLFLIFSGGCAFFSTPQERSGINPKPFNSQAHWEVQPGGGRFFN